MQQSDMQRMERQKEELFVRPAVGCDFKVPLFVGSWLVYTFVVFLSENVCTILTTSCRVVAAPLIRIILCL